MKVSATLQYEHKQQIGVGEGQNSTVYLIDEPQLGGELIAKEIPKTPSSSPSEYFAEAHRLFAASHENVVPIRYACDAGSHVSLVMPYFPRGSLKSRIEDGPMAEHEVVPIALDVLRGVAHIHARNLIHFDIKPSNVLFSDAGTAMVADFGQTRTMSGLGTVCPLPPIYSTCRPPEAVTGAVASVQTDIYQVGLLLYRMVNGDPWFKDQSSLPRPELEAKITKGRFPDRKRFYPHVTRHMRTVIRKALSLDPLQRYQTATEMATVLGRVDVSRWEIEVTPHRTTWTWERKAPHADVMVEECRTTAGTSVAVFTLGDVKRAKSPGALRRRGLTPEASWKHLNDVVFPTLRKSL